MEGCSDHQSLIAQQTGLECVMGVWQSGHACFSLHHSVIQFLHRAHQTGDERTDTEVKGHLKNWKNAGRQYQNNTCGSSC